MLQSNIAIKNKAQELLKFGIFTWSGAKAINLIMVKKCLINSQSY